MEGVAYCLAMKTFCGAAGGRSENRRDSTNSTGTVRLLHTPCVTVTCTRMPRP